jgi:DUF1680 family protein
VYDESDVYKWVEAAYWVLSLGEGEGLLGRVDAIVKDLEAAQRKDGYLNTYYVGDLAGDRWTNLQDHHELYSAGHLIQAGIAGHRAVGDNRLLNVAVRLADHICTTFGPGKLEGTSGHPEIEMALVELFRETKEARYLEQANYFLDARGYGQIGGQEYHQDHAPFRELDRLTGHAVRGLYLCAGAADTYLETGEKELLGALERLWEQMTSRQMYISGGVGGRAQEEAFGKDYELPNMDAYAESCAAIANLVWNWRMFHINVDCRYADLVETILYNGMLSGIAADGCSYFYRNPLASDGAFGRAAWYSTACCPPNLARTLATLPGMIYSRSEEGVWVNLFIASQAVIEKVNGGDVELALETDYPWDGRAELVIDSRGVFDLHLRIPGWAGDSTSVLINGEKLSVEPVPGSFYRVRREWVPGDRVQLSLAMKPRFIVSHPKVDANLGRVALQRGPLVYCLEEIDNPNIDPNELIVNPEEGVRASYAADILGGMIVLEGVGVRDVDPIRWGEWLYRGMTPRKEMSRKQIRWTAVPYFAWANRGEGWMRVWNRFL